MLALVAVLFVIVISALVKTHGGGNGADQGPLDAEATSASSSDQPSGHSSPGGRTSPPTRTHSPSATATTPAAGVTSCPTSETCILEGDVGNAIPAINDYRTRHGQPAIPGEAAPQAQNCALRNGNGCSGGWAETLLSDPDGRQAVHKILPFAHLLDPQMTSIQVGWAYDPGAKLFYFAIIRID
jgi:hypothetical protein